MNFDEGIREQRLALDEAKIRAVRHVCEFADEQLTDEQIEEYQTNLAARVQHMIDAVREIQALKVSKSVEPIRQQYASRYEARFNPDGNGSS